MMPAQTRKLTALSCASVGLFWCFFALLPLLRGIDDSGAPVDGLLGVGSRAARWLWPAAFCGDPRYDGDKRLLVIGAFVLLVTVFLLQVRAASPARLPQGLRLRTICIFAALFSLPMVLTDFPFFTDIHSYIIYGRIPVLHHGNPYFDPPQAFPDVFTNRLSVIFRYTPSVYGPIWTSLSQVLTYIVEAFGGAPWLYVLSYKLVMVAAHLGCTGIVYRLVERYLPSYCTVATLAYAYNPLMIAETAWTAHNDGVLLLATLVSLWFFSRGADARGFAFLVASVFIKWITVLLVPLYLAAWVKRTRSGSERIRVLARSAAIFFAIVATSFAPYWRGPETMVQPFQYAVGRYYTGHSLGDFVLHLDRGAQIRNESGPSAAREVDAAYGDVMAHFDRTGQLDWSLLKLQNDPGLDRGLRGLANGILLLVCGIWVRRVWRSPDFESLAEGMAWCLFTYVTVSSFWFAPWYLIPVVGLLMLVPNARAFRTALVASLAAWAIYMGAAGWFGRTGYQIRALLGLGPPLGYLAWSLLNEITLKRKERFVDAPDVHSISSSESRSNG